jgi:3-hydroxybutyryl-CoA dehydrogenase
LVGGIHPINRVGVVGGGMMGTGIAEVCARAGLNVKLLEAVLALIGTLGFR